jgi:flagellar basal body-associated protein FliL
MNTWVEAPPQRKGMGCVARGCLILLVFAIVLMLACVAGVFWGFQRNSAIMHGIYWLAKTHSIAEAPVSLPEFSVSDNQTQAVREKWQDFEQKTRAVQPAEIELTADDINSLIAADRHARGKVFVSIEGNKLHVQTSAPIGEFVGRPGYYFTGDITAESAGPESLENVQLNRITVNGEHVPGDTLNWTYRSRRLRDYVVDYLSSQNIGTAEVRDGKVILRSRTE